ncbi:MAG: TonB-dependent receptor [Tannerellaceae bacterium]|nr:TonB-dependent receptor [Tannerellaceae bacterium]
MIGGLSSLLTVWAAEADSLAHKQIYLEDVVVHSFKEDKKISELPLSATVINGTAIRNRTVTGMKDFSSLVPNLFIPDYGSKLTSPVFIRGIGSKINSPSVGLYVDGMPYFEKAAFDFDFAEVNQVEVLRGPQGTLYGRNTMGGIINVYTRSPLDYQGTTLNVSAGSYMTLNGSVSHYGKISENLGYMVAGNYNHSNGYFTNQYSGDKADALDEASGRFRLDWQVKPQLLIRFMSTIDYLDQAGYPYAPYDTETWVTGPVNYDEYSFYKRTMSTSGAMVEYTTDRFKLNSQTTYQYLSDDQEIDQDFTEQHNYFAIQKLKQNMVAEEINIKSNTGSRYNWLFGAFGFRQGVDNNVDVNYHTRDSLSHKEYDVPTYGVAVYHQSTLDDILIPGLSLTVGVRYDYERASTTYDRFATVGGTYKKYDDFTSKLNFSQLTPKFALQYTTPRGQMIYGTITKGFKTGGFNTSFERDEDRSFDPEYSWNYELGTKLAFFENRLKAEAAVFYIDWKNQQIYQPMPSNLPGGQMLKNAGRSESKGIELSVQGNPLNGLMIQGAYGYTHAKFKDYQRSETLDYSDHYLPLVPRHTLSAGVDYTFSNLGSALDRMTFSVNYTGAGKIYWADDNVVTQPYYGLLNARVAATKGIVTTALWAKNITNQEYIAYYFASGTQHFAQTGRPFTIGANVIITF